jgi:hypothetical protein
MDDVVTALAELVRDTEPTDPSQGEEATGGTVHDTGRYRVGDKPHERFLPPTAAFRDVGHDLVSKPCPTAAWGGSTEERRLKVYSPW